MGDVEERLKLLDKVASSTGLNGVGERLNCIVSNNLTSLDDAAGKDAGQQTLQGVGICLADDSSKSEDRLGLHVGGVV